MNFSMKNMVLIIISLFCIGPKLAIGSPFIVDQRDALVNGRYLIKWEHKTEGCRGQDHNYYFFAEVQKDENTILRAAEKIAPESIFVFEKNEQGFKIKNVKHNRYLYVAGRSHKEDSEPQIVKLYEDVRSGSYFKIVKPGQEYQGENEFLIQNKRSKDYLRITEYCIGGTKIKNVKYWEIEDHKYCLFSLVPYTENFFKQD